MTRTDPKPDPRPFANVTARRIRREDAGNERSLTVFCPRIAETIDVRDCRSCDHGLGLSIDASAGETVLRCTWQNIDASERSPAALDETAPTEIEAERLTARDTPLSAIMTSPARSVTQDTRLTALLRLFLEQGISAAPVVDSGGKAIGIVSKTDVVRRYLKHEAAHDSPAHEHAKPDGLAEIEDEGLACASVREVMTHLVYTLAAEASISRAAALMAYEGVHRIVVAAPDGTALGIVSALDILRWMARQDGYVVPDLTRIQTDERSKRPE
jgi:CBS domain-containing protein